MSQKSRLGDGAPRPTEGGVVRTVANKTKLSGTHSERKRGRPPGSRNKPKALIPSEVASELLGVVRQILPPELYQEMKEAVRSGKNISTINEAKILMKLMGPPVWQRLIEEAKPAPPPVVFDDPDMADEIGPMEQEAKPFDKDLNERLKVLLQVMQFVDKLEKNDEGTDNTAKPILEVFARKGVGAARIDFITNDVSGSVGGNADGVRRGSVEVRAIPSELSQGPFDVSYSEQVETTGVLDPDSTGDDTQGGDEPEL